MHQNRIVVLVVIDAFGGQYLREHSLCKLPSRHDLLHTHDCIAFGSFAEHCDSKLDGSKESERHEFRRHWISPWA